MNSFRFVWMIFFALVFSKFNINTMKIREPPLPVRTEMRSIMCQPHLTDEQRISLLNDLELTFTIQHKDEVHRWWYDLRSIPLRGANQSSLYKWGNLCTILWHNHDQWESIRYCTVKDHLIPGAMMANVPKKFEVSIMYPEFQYFQADLLECTCEFRDRYNIKRKTSDSFTFFVASHSKTEYFKLLPSSPDDNKLIIYDFMMNVPYNFLTHVPFNFY